MKLMTTDGTPVRLPSAEESRPPEISRGLRAESRNAYQNVRCRARAILALEYPQEYEELIRFEAVMSGVDMDTCSPNERRGVRSRARTALAHDHAERFEELLRQETERYINLIGDK